jgi:hypothetical protein
MYTEPCIMAMLNHLQPTTVHKGEREEKRESDTGGEPPQSSLADGNITLI